MFDDIYQVPTDLVKKIEYLGDPLYYDLQLYELGEDRDEFLVINPVFEEQWKTDLKYYVDETLRSRKCLTYTYNDQWVVKIFPNGWYPYHGYDTYEIVKPKLVWNRNPDIDRLMTFENDPYGAFDPMKWDREYRLVWYIDPRFNPLEDKVWAFSCQPIGEVKGTKDMGYVVPDVSVEFNPHLPDLGVDANDCFPAFYDLPHECAYELDPVHQTDGERLWVVKFTPNWRKPKEWKWLGTISPEYKVVYNPDLPKLDYDLDYVIPWHDFGFEHVWMLDRQHLRDDEEDIWAFTIQVSEELEGTKIVDYITPNVHIEYNPHLPQLTYDVDYVVPWHDLGYEHLWLLDKRHYAEQAEDIYAFRVRFSKKVRGSKVVAAVSPKLKYELNPHLPKLSYDLAYDIPYYDLTYEYVWMLDRRHLKNNEEDIWAVKVSAVDEPAGTKFIGSTSPRLNIEINSDVPTKFKNIDYDIPYHDLAYEHVWYVDPQFSNNEKVWAFKARSVEKVKGVKDVGYVSPSFAAELDVIFISYKEPNAEENWQRVLEKAPRAKRVTGVEGIFNAHREAAKISSTDMFYVVDGDALLEKNWNFDYQPSVFDRNCAYVWSSRNPVNDLIYPYGGVKLFSREILLKMKSWQTLDLFGSMPKIKTFDAVSCVTAFNTDEFSTWRSAFRESVKLYMSNQLTKLDAWMTRGKDRKFGKYALAGARAGYEYAAAHVNDPQALLKINDYSWLKKSFNKQRRST